MASFWTKLPPDPQKEVGKKNAVWSGVNSFNKIKCISRLQKNNPSVMNAKIHFITFKRTFQSVMLLEKMIISEISSTNRNFAGP